MFAFNECRVCIWLVQACQLQPLCSALFEENSAPLEQAVLQRISCVKQIKIVQTDL